MGLPVGQGTKHRGNHENERFLQAARQVTMVSENPLKFQIKVAEETLAFKGHLLTSSRAPQSHTRHSHSSQVLQGSQAPRLSQGDPGGMEEKKREILSCRKEHLAQQYCGRHCRERGGCTVAAGGGHFVGHVGSRRTPARKRLCRDQHFL